MKWLPVIIVVILIILSMLACDLGVEEYDKTKSFTLVCCRGENECVTVTGDGNDCSFCPLGYYRQSCTVE